MEKGMNEDIMKWAREADTGFDGGPDADGTMLDSIVGIAAVKRFAALVAAAERKNYEHTLALQQKSYEREIKIEVEAEREACAKVCEDIGNTWALDCAATIRARGQE